MTWKTHTHKVKRTSLSKQLNNCPKACPNCQRRLQLYFMTDYFLPSKFLKELVSSSLESMKRMKLIFNEWFPAVLP